MAQQEQARIDAIVASAFNLAAQDEPSLRALYPSGMSPARAAELPKSVRVGWLESYIGSAIPKMLARHEQPLYSTVDAQTAINALRAA